MTISLNLTSIMATNDAEKCQEHSQALKSYHQRLMDYSSPTSNKKYLDLVREKNSINAAMTLTDALTRITDEYYDYLGSMNESNIKKISDLQILLQAQAPAATRMTYAVDMMTVIGDDEIQGNRQERFQIIANKLRASCNQNRNTSFCRGLSSNFWNNLSSNEERSEVTHDSMVEQFIHVSAASNDVGTHFVQDSRFDALVRQDPASQGSFTSLLSQAVDEAAKNCANVDLLRVVNTTVSDDDKCLNLKIEDLQTVNGSDLVRSLGATRTNITTLGDVVGNYLERVNSVRDGQLKLTGELVNQYRELSTANFNRADSQISDNARRLRMNFDKLKTHLAGTLHGAFKLAASNNNLQALLNGVSAGSLNPHADDIIDNLNSVTSQLTGLSSDLFKVGADGKMSFDNTNLAQALANDQLKPRRMREMKTELQAKLAAVDAELASFKEQEGFTVLEKLQEFTWGNVRYFCGDKSIDREDSTGNCSYIAGYNHGLENLLDTSTDMNRLARLEQEEAEIEELLAFCNDDQNMAAQRDILDSTCTLIFARSEDLRERRLDEVDRIERREEFIRESDTYAFFEEDNRGRPVFVERRPRRNWLREGLSRGVASAATTLVPVGINYFQQKGSLLTTVGMAQSRMTYQAFAAAQATFPTQQSCYMYMCGNNSYQVSPTMSAMPYYANNGYIDL